jgi:hypothetical protein
MRRVLLLALAVALLAVPAAGAAPKACWQRVIEDWYVDGRLDGDWTCNCVREAIAHLPVDGMTYARFDALYTARRKACRLAARHVTAPAQQAETHDRNWPALITTTVLGVAVIVLFLRRRKQLLERRRRRDRS